MADAGGSVFPSGVKEATIPIGGGGHIGVVIGLLTQKKLCPIISSVNAPCKATFGQGIAGLQEDLGISADTQDMAALATFAEHYNGLGYHYKDEPSPYVWAGTDQYESGKYVADGVYDANHVDQQPGVAYLISGLRDRAAQEE